MYKKGSLETVEIKISKVFETLDLPKDRFLIFAAIFGHDNLTEEDLKDFFSSFEEVSASQTQTKVKSNLSEDYSLRKTSIFNDFDHQFLIFLF